MPSPVHQTDADIAVLSRRHLEAAVAIDSQSDERSETIPSTEGQRHFAEWLVGFFRAEGCPVEIDDHANVVVSLPGRGRAAGQPPLALMVHLDTARGTRAVPALQLEERWRGTSIPYPGNSRLKVDVANYPAVREFIGQDLLFGPGDAPFGLDDKLGLAHLMTLAVLLRTNPGIEHPPLLLVCRPDEEIGRMAAVEGVAALLAARGVRYGYTIDGILPFEVNLENFNASHARLAFPNRKLEWQALSVQADLKLFLGGVNSHGATAKAEGSRAATRFAAELFEQLRASGLGPERVVPVWFRSLPHRDCDGELIVRACAASAPELAAVWAQLARTVELVIGPHVPRGASFTIGAAGEPDPALGSSRATCDAIRFTGRFLASTPGFPLAAENSEGREGYSNPYRIMTEPDGTATLDVRLRDFVEQGLRERERHVETMAREAGALTQVTQQYVNMGPRLSSHPNLLAWASRAASRLGIEPRVLPIRGGTGVDPFLDRGIPVANLGTGYFAPESEKEFTSLQMMSGHARWLVSLVTEVAQT